MGKLANIDGTICLRPWAWSFTTVGINKASTKARAGMPMPANVGDLVFNPGIHAAFKSQAVSLIFGTLSTELVNRGNRINLVDGARLLIEMPYA
jgi:hypothetical protein